MTDKIIDIIFWSFILVIIAFVIFIIWIIIDFKNDYDCSTTTDVDWYVEHNCMRYER